MARSVDPIVVVRSHLRAVRRGDSEAMAADYAPHAVLRRPDATYRGRTAIAEYFSTVPERLGGGVVEFTDPAPDVDGWIAVSWRIVGGPGDGARGRDRFLVDADGIVAQTVVLDGADF